MKKAILDNFSSSAKIVDVIWEGAVLAKISNGSEEIVVTKSRLTF